MRKVFHLAAAFLSGALVWHFFLMSLQVLSSRNGMVGGEVLFLPLMALVFYAGWAAKDEIIKLK